MKFQNQFDHYLRTHLESVLYAQSTDQLAYALHMDLRLAGGKNEEMAITLVRRIVAAVTGQEIFSPSEW